MEGYRLAKFCTEDLENFEKELNLDTNCSNSAKFRFEECKKL